MRLLALTLLAAIWAPPALAATPITLDQAMADPDWIGAPVETAWWSWDSKQVYYKVKRDGSPLRDIYQARTTTARLVGDAELARLDSPAVVYNRDRSRALLLRNGDLFERDLKNGALVQLTRGSTVTLPQYGADEAQVQFRVGQDWFGWRRSERLVTPLALPRASKDPAAAPDEDAQRALQLRLIATLARIKDERDAKRTRSEEERRADSTRAPAPLYLGENIDIDTTVLSPDGRFLLVVTAPKSGDKGRVGKMPRYVTESGYEEFDEQRTRVGRNLPSPQTLVLADLLKHTTTTLSYDALPGIATDPLAELRAARKLDALKGNRSVRVADDGEAIHWNRTGNALAVILRSVDNKDRWLVTVDLATAKLKLVQRSTDTAWINEDYQQFGWLPDNRTLWFQSEDSGYAHLYTAAADGAVRALTRGSWEASQIEWSADGSTAYMVCNPKAPGTYEVCAVSAKDGVMREVTALGGVENFTLSPDERKLLLRYSSAYLPPQVATINVNGSALAKLSDTRKSAYAAREWIEPQIVAVPSTHGAAPIWAKLYRPATLEAGRRYPVVMFVHGAGYLQNVSKRYPNYFREQMFHNLLVQQGYIVLDMDYRASQGYGRNWRTAIYRQMGHPELEDYVDGVNWMVAQQQGDAKNVGIYGGSYGGFMTFMALLREPGVFKAGAALRPVTDWTSYNHGYTANILNTPDLDPEAYRTSSPIEYADQLRGHLLIAHGMVDDNVFYQDSVRMAQRLIELKKDHWELAGYPLERHAFVQPESWYDEYRRIYQLFERTLK